VSTWEFCDAPQAARFAPVDRAEGVRVDNQSADFIPGESREGKVDFTFTTGVQLCDAQTESARSSLQITHLGQGQRNFGLIGAASALMLGTSRWARSTRFGSI
jgi:hypothetical protein